MLKWIEKTANGRIVLIFFALAIAAYLVMLLVTIPAIRESTGGVEVFDLRYMGYSVDEARFILSSLPEAAKSYYSGVQIPIDFAYPLLLALFGAFTLGWARRRVAIPRWTIVLPFFVVFFDYLENIFVLLMLRGSDSTRLISVANIWTVSKSISTTLVMSGLVVILAIFAIKSIAARRTANAFD